MTLHVLFAGKPVEAVEAIRPALMENDCQVISATGIALALFLANKNYPDLVLCNVEMSDGTGLDLLKELKADPHLAKIPIVVFSESPANETQQEAMSAGAEQFISGPIDPKTLMLGIHRHLTELKDERPEETPE